MRAAPPLNALRAFDAAARHLSLTKAAQELNVTSGAISHQIPELETLSGAQCFERALVIEKLVELSFLPVCSPRLIERHGPLRTVKALARAPLIHDDTFASRAAVPTWADWFRAAGIEGVNVTRGLRFNSSDHAL